MKYKLHNFHTILNLGHRISPGYSITHLTYPSLAFVLEEFLWNFTQFFTIPLTTSSHLSISTYKHQGSGNQFLSSLFPYEPSTNYRVWLANFLFYINIFIYITVFSKVKNPVSSMITVFSKVKNPVSSMITVFSKVKNPVSSMITAFSKAKNPVSSMITAFSKEKNPVSSMISLQQSEESSE
jgi:hypothetical protein